MIDLLLNLNYISELKWIFVLAVFYFGYQFTQTFIDISVRLGLVLIIFSVTAASYLFYKMKISTPNIREYLLKYMIDLVKVGLERRIQFDDVVMFCKYVWNI